LSRVVHLVAIFAMRLSSDHIFYTRCLAHFDLSLDMSLAISSTCTNKVLTDGEMMKTARKCSEAVVIIRLHDMFVSEVMRITGR